jgi:hypothetical protein
MIFRASLGLLCVCFASPFPGVAQELSNQIRESIWRLDNHELMPNSYTMAVVGSLQKFTPATGALGECRLSHVRINKGTEKVIINAANRESINLTTMEATPSHWKVSLHDSTHFNFLHTQGLVDRFDEPGKLNNSDKGRREYLEKITSFFDPRPASVSYQTSAYEASDSRSMLFSMFELGKIVSTVELGSKIQMEWRVGGELATKVTMHLDRINENTFLPTLTTWMAPIPGRLKDEMGSYVTFFVARTEWESLKFEQDGTIKEAWVPKNLQTSRRLGFGNKFTVEDAEYRFFWSEGVSSKVLSNWENVDWNLVIEEMVEGSRRSGKGVRYQID